MKLITTTLTAIAIALPAYADTVRATVSRIDPIYHNTTVNTPRNICQNVEVPIYGTVQGGGATGGDVLGGMILGALLGKGVSGNDKGAGAGAVFGGIIAADKANKSRQVVTGYRSEQQCQTVYESHTAQTLKHYKIWFTWNGHEGTAMTYNKYQVGNRIPVEVSLRAK